MKTFLFTTLLTVASLSIFAQSDTLKWTPEKHMEFRSISGTDISDDGQYVAYVVREPVMEGEKSEYLQQIWVAKTDGSMNVQYTRGDKSSFSPTFSPDGQQIAFLSSRADKTQLFVMRLMGGEARQITEEKDGISSIQWSPDGTQIAFLKRDENTEEEEKMKKEKRDVIEVDQNFKYSHLYTVDLTDDAYPIQRLTTGDFHITSYDWSPDGKTIVFGHKEDPKINTNRVEADISWVPSDSGAVTVLIDQKGPDRNPRFSPDGKSVVFQSEGGKAEPIGLSDLYLADIETGKFRALPRTENRAGGIIDWSQDGKYIYLSDAHHTSRVVIKVPIDENQKPEIVTDENAVISSVDFAKNGQMAYVYQDTDTPPDLYFLDDDYNLPKQLSRINADIELPKMGKTEVVTWKSKDGMEIEGLLTYPVDYVEGEKVPLVLQIHGGPAGVFTQSFTGNPSIYMTQYFAQEGVAVLRPNPRGSTGYGKDFRFANFKDWGFGDYEDVMSGVDKVIEMGVADEERMTVMGWSYGGYLTSFLVTRTDRFKAASMGAGLPNLISMTSTTDIPDYLVGHMGGEFWDDYETYEKHSAMYHIKNVKTPTQVIHGENDLRVPFTQGQEFYVALKRRGVPTEMLVLPRTPHGPREPKLLMEVSPRILKWFEAHTPRLRS